MAENEEFGMNVALTEEQEVSNPMIKRVLFSFLLMVTVFTCVGWADSIQITHFRIKFKIDRPFLLESDAKYAVPAGEYLVREMWPKDMPGPGHLFSIERAKDHKHIALITTVRIDRARHNWRHRDRVFFDYENPLIPVFKEFYVSGADGWEVIEAEYKKDYLIEVATLTEAKYTITQTPMEVEKPAPVVEPEPEPAPVEEPAIEKPREEPKPVEPVAPIQERKRVRKD
jgi:hypothetical protein